ncbi:acylphosphatase [Trichothermofontia sp.]
MQPGEAQEVVGAHVWISGHVQGVFYRGATQDQARQLGVNGWVRNLADGRVEAYFEGSRAQVAAMIDWCHQGPPAAIVDHVQVQYEAPVGSKGFQVRR